MQKIEQIKNKAKIIGKKVFNYLFLILGLIASFTIGYYFNHIIELNSKQMPEVIKRSEVTIAIDESSNIMIIAKLDGSYTLLQDSVGIAIFNIYAKNIFNNQNVKKIENTNEN